MWQLDFAAIQFQYSGLDKRCTTPVCVSFSLFLFICSLSLLGPREADLPGQIQPVTHSPTTWQEPRLLWQSRSSCLFHRLSPSFFLLRFLPVFLGGGVCLFVCLFFCFSKCVSLYYFLIFKELTDERPVPVTLFCSNRMGEFISIADFLVSEGLALRQRKPRCVSACSTCIVGSGVLVCTGLFSFSK